jgi:hypothetical protein
MTASTPPPGQPPDDELRDRADRLRRELVLNTALSYVSRGWRPIPVPHGEKAPRLTGWPDLKASADDLPGLFPMGSNLGLILGDVPGGLVDVDLDTHRRQLPQQRHSCHQPE